MVLSATRPMSIIWWLRTSELSGLLLIERSVRSPCTSSLARVCNGLHSSQVCDIEVEMVTRVGAPIREGSTRKRVLETYGGHPKVIKLARISRRLMADLQQMRLQYHERFKVTAS